MYTSMGYGLGLGFEEIMKLPSRWASRLSEMLAEQIEKEQEAMKEGR